MTSPYTAIPPYLRSTVRSYLNSEQDKDIERALEYCEQYGLDYEEARRLIIAEMTRDYDANEPLRERRRRAKP